MSEIIWFEKMTSDDLQAKLDAQIPNACLELLQNREYPAPLTIRSPLTLDGHGATLWSFKGPVVRITAPACLRNLRIEVTGDQSIIGSEEECAIVVMPGVELNLENVEVRGQVRGLTTEEGSWLYPHTLTLGCLACGCHHQRILRIFVPVDCRLDSHISGIEVKPKQLQSGLNQISLQIEKLSHDTLLNGYLLLSTSGLRRRITLTAFIINSEPSNVIEQGQLIWEPQFISVLQSSNLDSTTSSQSFSSKPDTSLVQEDTVKSRLRQYQVPGPIFKNDESDNSESNIIIKSSEESTPLQGQLISEALPVDSQPIINKKNKRVSIPVGSAFGNSLPQIELPTSETQTTTEKPLYPLEEEITNPNHKKRGKFSSLPTLKIFE